MNNQWKKIPKCIRNNIFNTLTEYHNNTLSFISTKDLSRLVSRYEYENNILDFFNKIGLPMYFDKESNTYKEKNNGR